jgi:hypothetical protein
MHAVRRSHRRAKPSKIGQKNIQEETYNSNIRPYHVSDIVVLFMKLIRSSWSRLARDDIQEYGQ